MARYFKMQEISENEFLDKVGETLGGCSQFTAPLDDAMYIAADEHEIDWPQFFTGYYSNGKNQSEGWKIYGIDSSGSTIGTPIDSDRIIRWSVQTDAIKEYLRNA